MTDAFASFVTGICSISASSCDSLYAEWIA